MAKIKIAMVESVAVHDFRKGGDLIQQGPFQFVAPAAFQSTPILGEILERDHVLQSLCDYEGFTLRRIDAPLPATRHLHGADPDAAQALDGLPFRARANDRRTRGEEVLHDFAPSATTVNFNKIMPAPRFELKRAPVFNLAIDFAVKIHQAVEGAIPRHVTAEFGIQLQVWEFGGHWFS